MKISPGPTFQIAPGTLPTSPTLLANYQFVGKALAALPAAPAMDEFTRRALTPSPALLAALGLSPASPPTPAGMANPDATAISPILRATKVHVFSPGAPTQPTLNGKLLEGVRAMSDIITPKLGPKTSLVISTLWLGVDTVSTVQTWRDPESTPGERLDAAGQLTDSAAAFLAGLFGDSQLQQVANGIHYAALVGDKMYTGHGEFTPSELAQISEQPQSDEAAGILKLSELFTKQD